MKLYIFKTIFIIIIIILLIFAGYSVYKTATKPKKLLEETEETTNNIVKEINLAIAEYDTINPVISNNKNVQDIAKLIYEPLLEITEKFQIKNNYVTEWSKVSEKAYLIKLKNDIKWHNGKTLSTADVKYTIELLKIENINSIYTDNVKNIDTVEIIDDTTIKINLKEEETFFEYNLIFPILPNNSKTTEYIGTGLYKIDLINENSIKLIKNDNYWNENKKATIDVVNIKLYNSMGEVYNAFKLGYVDIINTSNLNYKEYVGKIGYNTAEYVGREYDFLVLNNDNDILNNKNVRQALLYSIDRQKIINEVYDGNYYLTEFPLDYGSFLYTKGDIDIKYDINMAKDILINDGWKYEYNVWRKYENYRYKRLNFNLIVNNSNENRVKVAENIKEQLSQLGINVTVIKLNDRNYEYYIKNNYYDMLLTGTNVGITPSLETYFGEGNLNNYKNQVILRIMDDIKNITDEELLKEKYKQIVEEYKKDIPFISLYNNRNVLVYDSKLFGTIRPNFYNIFYNFENWYKTESM